jgi:murein DD-endopeptidase MepM/ murein hydrolase activator NlpD
MAHRAHVAAFVALLACAHIVACTPQESAPVQARNVARPPTDVAMHAPIDDDDSIEIRFCPAAQARTYPLESQRDISSLVLQNMAVVNRGDADVRITEVDVDLLRGAEALDSRRIAGADLEAIAAKGPKLQRSGVMKLVAFQFCGDALVGDGVTLAGPALGAHQAMLATYQPFAFKGARDALKVTVHYRAAHGDASATATLPIVSSPSKTELHFPLKGSWFVAVGPTPHTAHRWGLPEEFAFDIARIGDGNASHRGAGDHLADYYAYGAEVLAAADGKVARAVNDALEDEALLRKAGESDDAYGARAQEAQMALLQQGGAAAAGNYVVIDHGDGEYSLYAHLQKGSVRVRAGDVVKVGEPIGLLGSSGNSTEPHLHFQLCDAPDPLSCAGIPMQVVGISLPYADYPRPLQSGDIVVAK